MKNRTAALAALCLSVFVPGSLLAANAYLVRNLVSDVPFLADNTDPNLKGAWGISESATSPFWVADAASGVSTLYGSNGGVIPLVVTIPPAKGGMQGIPTGTVWNGSGGFEVATGKSAVFLFDTLDGTISGWNSTVDRTHAVVEVDNSSTGAAYTGLALASNTSTSFIYAANFHAGTIDVFDTTWKPVATPNGFVDKMLPAGYAPFNVQNLGGKLYVAYALQNADKSFAATGAGKGFVDVYDISGNLLQRISAAQFNAPWGLAIAPAGFGDFSGDLLVANFGDGTINAFNPASGAFVATLNDVYGSPIVVPNLWALQPGNGASGGDSGAVYFTAGIPGPDNGTHGLFGRLQAAPVITPDQVLNGASFKPGIAPNTWIAIKATSLSATTRSWQSEDFINGALPTMLDLVNVMINNQPGYLAYISPRQLNVLVPAGTPPGPAQITVINQGLASAVVNVQVQTFAPAFFLAADGTHVAATHADGSLVGPAGKNPSEGTPAKPGETIILYGTGFGQTTPPIPGGMLVTTAAPVANSPTILIGGVISSAPFVGLTGPGLYQINVTVPPGTPDGDIPVVAQVSTQVSPGGAVIAVQH